MSNSKILTIVVIVGVLGVVVGTASFTFDAKAQESIVPDWIKNVAQFWSNDEISDQEFVNSIEFLVGEGIMEIPSSVNVAQAEDITKSISELEGRIDQLELEQPTTVNPDSSEYQKSPTIEESLVKGFTDDSGIGYVAVVCPYDKVRHFDTVWFRFNPEGYDMICNDSNECFSNDEDIVMTLERNSNAITAPVHIQTRIIENLKEEGFSVVTKGGYWLNEEEFFWEGREIKGYETAYVKILDYEHSVICANKPPLANTALIGEIYK